MHLVTNLLELVNLVQKFNYAVDSFVLTYSSLVPTLLVHKTLKPLLDTAEAGTLRLP